MPQRARPVPGVADSPAGQLEHRGVRAVQTMVEYAPSSGGLALWVAHRDLPSDPEGVGPPVHTDGLALHYAPAFCGLPLREQAGWVAHEVLHIALRHAQRFDQLRQRLGDVDLQLFNRCADAIVNSALAQVSWLSLPADAIRLEQVLDEVLGERADTAAALLAWDVERLYLAVDDRRVDSGGARSSRSRPAAAEGTGERGAPAGAQGHARRDGPRAARLRTLGSTEHDDLRPAAEGGEARDESELARDWLERLLRAHADDGELSLLRTLLADLPTTRTPWEQVLRHHATRALAQRPGLSWSRPSRSYLASRGCTPSGRRLPWEPGTTSMRPAPRLVVVVDVSGSIDDGLLGRFSREVEAIVRRLGAPIVLISGDQAVREERRVAPGRPLGLEGLATAGGGGTDFEPLIARALAHKPDLVIVLSDLEGPAGPPPRVPVLWAVPRPQAPAAAPFGRLLPIE